MNDRTLLYYSANTEDPAFEQRIIDDLVKKAGNIPIISVSHKPMTLGTNICVGEDKPFSYTSEWKQVLIGLKAATTKFVIAAESDCLYPPEYFTFTPPVEDMMYQYENIWMVWKHHNAFWKKTGYCEGAQMCGREYWIKCLEPLLPDTWETLTREEESALVKKIFPERRHWTGDPVISFKTRDGVSYRTTFDSKTKTKELHPYGKIEEVKQIFN